MDSKPLAQCLQDDRYRDSGITVAETVGALEACKIEIYLCARDGHEDE